MSHLVTRALVLTVAVALGGCASRGTTPAKTDISQLRERARAHPRKAEVQRELAFAEMLSVEGDPERARDQIARALSLAPDDARLLLLRGLERYLHGHPGDWLEQLIETLQAARSSERAHAPAVAEAAGGALGELVGVVPDYAETVRDPLQHMVERPGHIGPAARHALGQVLIRLAFRRGDADAVAQLARDLGCMTSWRVAGPFGPRAMLGFDRRHDAAHQGRHEERYDLGAGRGERPTRTVEARGCTTHLGGPTVDEAGTHYAETFVRIPHSGRYLLRLGTPNAAVIFVDGEERARLDARRKPVPRVTFHELSLSKGKHELTVKITSRHPNPVLAASLTTPSGHAAHTAGQGDGKNRASDKVDAPIGLELPRAEGPWSTYLRAALQVYRGDPVGARETMRHTDDNGEGSPAMLTLRTGAVLSDPLRPASMRRDRARELLRGIARRDPRAWYPQWKLAELDAADGQRTRAIERLRNAQKKWPDVMLFPLTRAELARRQGWWAEARGAARRAHELVPSSCEALQTALGLARRRERIAEVKRLSREVVACDARSSARLTELFRQRRWDDALDEIDRLAALEPRQHAIQALDRKLRVARGRGDDAAAERLLSRLRTEQPRSANWTLAHADRLLAKDKAKAARQALDKAIARTPKQARLRRVRNAVAGKRTLEPWRVDGLKAIEEFEASGRSYDAPQVLVLDYTVVRVFADASSLQLTHQIYKLQSEAAVDRHGEYKPPPGARLLEARTIKNGDHRPVEPDRIAGKSSLSMPDLEPGDYMETTYVRPLESPRGFPGGAVGDRFFFRSFETPFDHSELVVAAPQDMDIIVDPRGDAPAAQRARRDGLQVLRWQVEQSRPLTKEPMAVSPREWAPSINWGIHATWDRFVRGIRDVLADRNVVDPAARRLAQRVVGGVPDVDDPLKRARRLYAWVLANVEQNQDAFGLAPAMVASQTGNRARILAYLLNLVDVPADLVLARDIQNDHTRSELPNESTYEHMLVRVRPSGDDPVFLSMAQRGAPFGYLPPQLRGEKALVIAEGAPRIELPDTRAGQDRHEIDADVQLTSDGSARVEVVETYRGVRAVGWRNKLDGVPSATLEQRFESQYLGRIVPGARLQGLSIRGRETPEEPLVFRYTFEVASLGRRSGTNRVVPALYATELAPNYARTSSRDTAQVVAPPQDLHVTLRLHVPDGASLPEPPDTVTLEGPGGAQFSMRASHQDGALRIERRVRVPIMRLEPSSYPAFARFCRHADSAEERELHVEVD